MEADTRTYDIVIVGGGLVGSALACALMSSAYRVAVIESAPLAQFSRDNFFDPRVVALNPASQQFLAGMGLWEALCAQRVSPFESMEVWDAEGTAQIGFSAADVQRDALGAIVENSLLVTSLQQRWQQASNIISYCPDRVTDIRDEDASACVLSLQSGEVLRSQLVIAADGALSAVRKLAGIQTVEWDYGHNALVATVRTERPHDCVARQSFMVDGPLAFLPLRTNDGDLHWSSIVWSTVPDAAQALLEMPEEVFAQRLAQAFEHRLGAVCEVRGRFMFPLRQRHAQVYQRRRVVLIGDAAHTIHPLAGQGANLGFMDVKVLAEELLAAQEKNLSPAHPAVLKRYQRRRRGANLSMTVTMELFRRLFARRELPVRWLRNTGMHGVDALPVVKREIMRQAMGL